MLDPLAVSVSLFIYTINLNKPPWVHLEVSPGHQSQLEPGGMISTSGWRGFSSQKHSSIHFNYKIRVNNESLCMLLSQLDVATLTKQPFVETYSNVTVDTLPSVATCCEICLMFILL